MDERRSAPTRGGHQRRVSEEERPQISRREYERRKAARIKKLKIRRAVVLGCMAVILILIVAIPVVGVKKYKANKAAELKAQAEQDAKALAAKKAKEKVEITITSAGDCTLGTDPKFNESTSLPAYYKKEGPEYFFKNVKSIFEKDDLTIVNLEGPLTTSEDQKENEEYTFKGDPSYTEILTSGSVEAANLANNHAMDYGEQGYQDTKDALKKANIDYFGYDDVSVREVQGIKVGMVGIQQVDYTEDETLAKLKDGIQKAQDQGAVLIVVNIHWGIEKDAKPDETQINLAHAAIDQGATLVIGHHPHVVQGIEVYKGRYIAYSLGNFCFGGNSNPKDKDCMIFQQTFEVKNGKVTKDQNYTVIPCSISSVTTTNDYVPTPLEGEEKERVQKKIDERSEGLSTETTS